MQASEPGSFEDVLAAWVERNIFIGNDFDEASVEEIVAKARSDGVIPLTFTEESSTAALAAAVTEVAYEKNHDLNTYPYESD